MSRDNANGRRWRPHRRVAGLLSAPAAVAALVVAAALAAVPAGAASCSYPSAYPGDNAAKATLAAWMAGHAIEAGLPGELPVMGALVDSGLTNLKNQDSDSVGYFQMRTPIWDGGEYAGYGDRPSLQIQWFIDQALSARQRRLAAGDAAYGVDPSRWGEWVADVQRPAEQYRGRYQLRLDDARALIASGCQAPAEEGGGAGGQPGETPASGQPGDPGSGSTSEPDAQL
ncbi:MAG: hypothetical protein QOH13_825, partial [Thermoleophilaceae bacterium]|nr:hypothetical protein [Thermoleophilaceae bacterium]